MNLLHLRYALEVARLGSLNKAAQTLLVAVPNISRSIKELESDLGITIFDRTAKGMKLTDDGEELMGYARGILDQLEQLETFYKKDVPKKKRFAVTVPRASYISEAFAEFSKLIDDEHYELFYKETNALEAINSILEYHYDLGIIRYAQSYDRYFKAMLEEKNICYELITEFRYRVVMSKDHPLAAKKTLVLNDLTDYTELTHADTYIPSIVPASVFKKESANKAGRRIFVFERASQFELLSRNTDTYMWVSPIPKHLLECNGLVEKVCTDNNKIYRDVLIFKNGHKHSRLDNIFITELCNSKRKYI